MLRIGEVARRTGIPIATLRAWERRYGIPHPDRSAGGQRLYPEAEVARIQAVRQLVEDGRTPSAAARSVTGAPPTAVPAAGYGVLRHADQIVMAMTEAAIVTDLAGRIEFWNTAAERLYSWPAAQVLGRDIVEVLSPPADRPASRRRMGLLAQGRRDTEDIDVVRGDGVTITVRVTHTSLRDDTGQLAGIIGVSHATTDHRAGAEIEHLRAAQLESLAVLTEGALLRDDPDIATAAVLTASRVLAAPFAMFTELAAPGWLVVVAATSPTMVGMTFETKGSLSSYVIRTGRPVISHDLVNERRFNPLPVTDSFGLSSAVGVPFGPRGNPTGALVIGHVRATTYTPDDTNYLQAVANLIAARPPTDPRPAHPSDKADLHRPEISPEPHGSTL